MDHVPKPCSVPCHATCVWKEWSRQELAEARPCYQAPGAKPQVQTTYRVWRGGRLSGGEIQAPAGQEPRGGDVTDRRCLSVSVSQPEIKNGPKGL